MISKAVLLYNPVSGRGRAQRAAHAAGVVLRAAGVDAACVPTRAPGAAGAQAAEAIASGCDAVFACGGDGTVHEVLQGMVGTRAALGIIPLGTANSLAVDLGVPRRPEAAARAALAAEALGVAVGHIAYRERSGGEASRYFVIAAGLGADAEFFYQLTAGFKQRFGYAAYIVHAWRMWARHPYPPFEVEFREPGGNVRRAIVSQLLAVRITDFGWVVGRLAPGAALRGNSLRLVLFKTPRRTRYLQYMTNVLLRRTAPVRDVELVDAAALECRPLAACPLDPLWRGRDTTRRIYAEADGEVLGTLPVRISVVPDGVRLLVPAGH